MMASIAVTYALIPLLLLACFGMIAIWGLIGKLAGPRNRGWVFVMPCFVLGLAGFALLFAGGPARMRSEVKQLARGVAQRARDSRASIQDHRDAMHRMRSSASSTVDDWLESMTEGARHAEEMVGDVAESVRFEAEAIVGAQLNRDFVEAEYEAMKLDRVIRLPALGNPDGVISIHITETSGSHIRTHRGGILWTIATAILIAAFLGVGYVFLDASTRGHYTWSLRVFSVAAFAALCVAISSLRHQL